MLHTLEVKFERQFTLEEVENLKDAVYEFLQNYEFETNVKLTEYVDLVVCDAT